MLTKIDTERDIPNIKENIAFTKQRFQLHVNAISGILTIVAPIAVVKPVRAQTTLANFDAVDAYISSKMEELGIPGAIRIRFRKRSSSPKERKRCEVKT